MAKRRAVAAVALAIVLIGSGSAMATPVSTPAQEIESDVNGVPQEIEGVPMPSNDPSFELERQSAALIPAQNLADTIKDTYPNDYSGNWIDGDTITVAFAATAPKAATDTLNSSGFKYTIAENVGTSEKELVEASSAIHEDIVRLVGPGVEVFSGPSVQEKSFDVTVGGSFSDTSVSDVEETTGPGNSPSPAVSEEQLKREVLESVNQSALSGFTVNVNVAPEESFDDTGYGEAGGTQLNLTDGWAACTSAFVVSSRNNADLGVVTAGHCPNQLTQSGRYLFDFRAESVGSAGDIQVMRSPRMMDAWFHYDYYKGVPQYGNATAGAGRYICAFGRTTGRTCGYVQKLNQSGTSSAGTATGLTTWSGTLNRDGDSGGPVYIDNYAVGITKGNAGGLNYFSPIIPALQRFSLDLCVDPPGCQ